MRARIYQPAKTAMQAGRARTKEWILEFAPASARGIDPLMGWTSSTDTQSQVKLRFDTKQAALDYARDHGIDSVLMQSHERKPNIRDHGYAENFNVHRRGSWTH
ncbi:MAG: ETC complex I subunit [Pseudomonadota bacterium]